MIPYLVIIGYLIFIFFLTLLFKKFYKNSKEVIRKIIHIGIGPLLLIAQSLQISQITASYFTLIIFILILINYIFRIFPFIEDIDRKSFGTLFYCFSLLILINIFWIKDPLAMITGFFIMTFGDGLAGLLGKNFASKSWKIFNQTKSLIGTITMLLISIFIVFITTNIGGYDYKLSILAIPLLATLFEQVSILGLDNLTVPLISSFSFNLLISRL